MTVTPFYLRDLLGNPAEAAVGDAIFRDLHHSPVTFPCPFLNLTVSRGGGRHRIEKETLHVGRHSLDRHPKHASHTKRPVTATSINRTRRVPAHAAQPEGWRSVTGARGSISVGLMAVSLVTIGSPAALATVEAPDSPSTATLPLAASPVDAAPLKVAEPRRASQAPPQRESRKPATQRKPKHAKKPKPRRSPDRHRDADTLGRWIYRAIEIMRKHGIAVSDADYAAIRTVIMKESSGNPSAINNWDSNARAGIPSKGLMQTIDPTFGAHHLPGFDDIFDPVDNIIAGVRYTLSRYGSLARHPGLRSLANGGSHLGY